VVHGEKDYRVPISEALLLFEALQRRGVPSELLVFPDENHWIQRPRNIRRWYEVCLGFLARHLSAAS
jgi:dipeptidyl aminopeptidase/acylaminoacyl peptidase